LLHGLNAIEPSHDRAAAGIRYVKVSDPFVGGEEFPTLMAAGQQDLSLWEATLHRVKHNARDGHVSP
jgi:hypothetical protein